MKKFLTAGLLSGGLILSTATGAIAHTSAVSHHETCPESGVTQTVVTFNNDYNLTAVVSYRWTSSGSYSTANLAARPGTPKPTVSLPSHAVGTIRYYVTWSDNHRQPGSGESSLTIQPLESCTATTTTSTSTTTSTVPTTTSSSTSSTSTSSTSTSSTSSTSTTTTTAPPTITTAQVAGVQLTRPAPAPAVAGPTPVGGVQTGGGGTSDGGNQLLPLALGLGGIGAVTIMATRRRRQAS